RPLEAAQCHAPVHELHCYSDGETPARVVPFSHAFFFPRLTNDRSCTGGDSEFESLDLVRNHTAPGKFASRLDERVQIMAAGMELVGRLFHVPDPAEILEQAAKSLGGLRIFGKNPKQTETPLQGGFGAG